MKQVIVITGASSGFGALAARRLADAGHTVYAGMRATTGRNSPQVEAVNHYAKEHQVDADAGSVAAAILNVVDAPFGKRPFRVHVDPSQDGAEIVNGVADRVRAEMFRRIGLEDLLHPVVTKG